MKAQLRQLVRVIGAVALVAATFALAGTALVLGILGNVFDVQQYLGQSQVPVVVAVLAGLVLILLVAMALLARENISQRGKIEAARREHEDDTAARRLAAEQELSTALESQRATHAVEVAALRSEIDQLRRPTEAVREFVNLWNSGGQVMESFDELTIPWSKAQEKGTLEAYQAWLKACRVAVLNYRPDYKFRIEDVIAKATEPFREPKVIEVAGKWVDLEPTSLAKRAVRDVRLLLREVAESYQLGG